LIATTQSCTPVKWSYSCDLAEGLVDSADLISGKVVPSGKSLSSTASTWTTACLINKPTNKKFFLEIRPGLQSYTAGLNYPSFKLFSQTAS
jgi:hypothetical protein